MLKLDFLSNYNDHVISLCEDVLTVQIVQIAVIVIYTYFKDFLFFPCKNIMQKTWRRQNTFNF